MPGIRWPKVASSLWVLVPPDLQKVRDAYISAKNSKLSFKHRRMLIRKLLTKKKTGLCYSQNSTANFAKNMREKQKGRFSRPVFRDFLKLLET